MDKLSTVTAHLQEKHLTSGRLQLLVLKLAELGDHDQPPTTPKNECVTYIKKEGFYRTGED